MIDLCQQAPSWIRNFAPYVPGKPAAELARELGLNPDGIVKLASNENPLGVSPMALEAMRSALTDIARMTAPRRPRRSVRNAISSQSRSISDASCPARRGASRSSIADLMYVPPLSKREPTVKPKPVSPLSVSTHTNTYSRDATETFDQETGRGNGIEIMINNSVVEQSAERRHTNARFRRFHPHGEFVAEIAASRLTHAWNAEMFTQMSCLFNVKIIQCNDSVYFFRPHRVSKPQDDFLHLK